MYLKASATLAIRVDRKIKKMMYWFSLSGIGDKRIRYVNGKNIANGAKLCAQKDIS
jgi:hypothetical protein